jgi:Phosphotransferase enzyme family
MWPAPSRTSWVGTAGSSKVPRTTATLSSSPGPLAACRCQRVSTPGPTAGRPPGCTRQARVSRGPRTRAPIDVDELVSRPVHHVMPFLAGRPDDDRYLRELATSLAKGIQQRSADLEPGFCHGDLHGGNAHVTDDGTVTFFDFNSAGPGWRACDIAAYRWATNAMRLEGGSDDCWDDFLTGYREVRDLGVGNLAAVPLFVAARHLVDGASCPADAIYRPDVLERGGYRPTFPGPAPLAVQNVKPSHARQCRRDWLPQAAWATPSTMPRLSRMTLARPYWAPPGAWIPVTGSQCSAPGEAGATN